MPKYRSENLAPMFRLAAKLCLRMRKMGFTDNGGAIHSAERILNIWGLYLNYPGLSHGNNLRTYDGAVFSKSAYRAIRNGDKVFIEHVAPLRDLTRKAIERIANGASDEELEKYVRSKFQLVLLSAAETSRLNKLNRSRMRKNRLVMAGITLMAPRKQLRR